MNQNAQNQNETSDKKESTGKMTSKRIVAIIGIVLLILLYVITLVVAIVDTSASGKMFGLCLIASLFIPFLIWIYTWMYGKLTGRKTFADLNIGGEDHVTDEELREIMIQQAMAEDADNSEGE